VPNHSQICVVGHLGRDAEAKAVGERFVINFTVAVSRKVKDTESTTWWNVAYWCKSEKFASYLTKGTPVLVSGEPYERAYEKKDGTKGKSLEIDAKEVKLLGGKQEAAPAAPPRKADAGGSAGDSEPPFMRRGEWE
jgi:single-strand DNA-binding protein